MKQSTPFYVYIMSTTNNKVLYIGVTNNLYRRVQEHKQQLGYGFTSRYMITKLVYYEEYSSIVEAIEREKQLKWWKRVWKDELVMSMNPEWEELAPPYCCEDGWQRDSGSSPE